MIVKIFDYSTTHVQLYIWLQDKLQVPTNVGYPSVTTSGLAINMRVHHEEMIRIRLHMYIGKNDGPMIALSLLQV